MCHECAPTAHTPKPWMHVDMSQAAEANAVDVGIRRDAADGYQALVMELPDKELARSIELDTSDLHVTEQAVYESKALGAGDAGEFTKARNVGDAEWANSHPVQRKLSVAA